MKQVNKQFIKVIWLLLPLCSYAGALDVLLEPLPASVTNERSHRISPLQLNAKKPELPKAKVEAPKTLEKEEPKQVVKKQPKVTPKKELVEVTPVVKICTDEVMPILKAALIRRYNVEGDLKLTLVREWAGVTVGSDAWEIEMVRYPSQGLSNRMVLHFRVLCDGVVDAEVHLPVYARLMQDCLIPLHRVDRGAALNASDFEVRSVDALEYRNQLVSPVTDISSFESVMPLAADEPLVWRKIDQRPLVRRGEVVDVTAKEGVMSLNLKAVALENGGQGDFIVVRNLRSNKEFQARIINEKHVQVYF